jgi:hypothetical protein
MIKKILIKLYRFIRYNPYKQLYIHILFLSAFFRVLILLVPAKKLRSFMGVLNEEATAGVSPECYREAAKIAHVINRLCQYTPWESKCLVRAMTAQYLLRKKHIPSTLYLGVGKDDHNMTAHAWLRCGEFYVTGGTGERYAVVARFRT